MFKVRGGGGFRGTVGVVLLLEFILEFISFLEELVRLVRFIGFWLVDEVVGFSLLFWVVRFSFVVDGFLEVVLVVKVVYLVRLLVIEEEILVVEEFFEIIVDG